MWWLFQRWRPTVVHVQVVHINALYPTLLSWVLPFALIIRFGGNDIHKFPVESRLLRFVMKLSLRRAQQVQFNSTSLMSDATPYLRWAKGDITVVGDGARPGEWDQVAPLRRGTSICISSPWAASCTRRDSTFSSGPSHSSLRIRHLRLLIAGDGEEMAALAGLRAELGVGDRVQLLGRGSSDARVPAQRGQVVRLAIPHRAGRHCHDRGDDAGQASARHGRWRRARCRATWQVGMVGRAISRGAGGGDGQVADLARPDGGTGPGGTAQGNRSLHLAADCPGLPPCLRRVLPRAR